ncbi:TIGR04372 family glycosyltransferase [Mangrovibrevibacter kandeliae]|uniref:TIGR04372 family glycosyltransferase n=1 Tax=Mangrovibrevibacter kandeliae TaxID=2968473 RepID=UPI0021193A5A|nr:TIGR04372 family glycosyltransferase [Aurantimonas sp. CSK15Z-1]MCQ8782832.1 TIGR04372 family glycosyltransferase [Aurantimonas sp. CSK15Z-1]
MNRFANRFVNFAHTLYQMSRRSPLIPALLRTRVGRRIAFLAVDRLDVLDRRFAVEAVQRLVARPEDQHNFSRAARRRHERRPDDPARFDTLAIALLNSTDQRAAIATVFSPEADRFIEEWPLETNLIAVRVALGHETEYYRGVMAEALRGTDITPATLRKRIEFLKAAFAAGKLLKLREAIEFIGRQYRIISDHPGRATDREIANTLKLWFKSTLVTVKFPHIHHFSPDTEERTAVFFLSSTQALGHAILDPYYFVALNRDRYDRLVFVGPPLTSYRPASRACLQIVEEYGDYIETDSDLLCNLSWMHAGTHSEGNLTLVVDHYWALLRDAVHRTRDAADPFRHNDWHFSLPPYYDEVTRAFCAANGIDLSRPLVTMHVRDAGYHKIARQSFRDAAVESYRSAVEHLLASGYTVVRLGDVKMPPLSMDHPHYFELPFMKGYDYVLDPALIARSRFMIGSQSGPCAFARVLGVPVLTVNAVLHYTLLPTPMEMGCFKRYYRTVDGERVEMSLEEAVKERVYRFDNAYQFEDAGILLEGVAPEEVLAAVRDMIAWVDDPALAETEHQRRFRQVVEEEAVAVAGETETLDLPIADYVGISLAGYRISPTVAARRARLPHAAPPSGELEVPAIDQRPPEPDLVEPDPESPRQMEEIQP